jgi:hypothetical protein
MNSLGSKQMKNSLHGSDLSNNPQILVTLYFLVLADFFTQAFAIQFKFYFLCIAVYPYFNTIPRFSIWLLVGQ